MKRFLMKTAQALLLLVAVAAAIALGRLAWAKWQVANTAVPPILITADELGETVELTVLPLYEEAAVSDAYERGHGVAYLVQTDAAAVLMDLGNNPEQTDPAPLLANMQQAGVAADAAEILFISHAHPDHTGGLGQVGFDGRGLVTGETAVYAPEAMTVIGEEATVAAAPQILAPGVATLGRMPFVQPFPFWLWRPLAYEQVLAVNVAGRGVALITGCGHPSLERIVARAEALFDRPVVGVIGGLHYEGMTAAELAPHVDFLAAREPALAALSPHDSDALAIAAFRRAFSAAYRPIEVGRPIHFAAASVAHGDQ